MFDITIICNKQRKSPHETAKENVVFQLTTLSDGEIMKYEFWAMEKRYWQRKIKVPGKTAFRGAVLSNQYFV
jgi:hypothetical protein